WIAVCARLPRPADARAERSARGDRSAARPDTRGRPGRTGAGGGRMIALLRRRLGSPAARGGRAPSMGSALGVWVLGTAWALCCLWLWRIGTNRLVPVALLGALLTLWGWRSVRWLHWFPAAAIAASLLDLAAPLPAHSATAGLGYVGMVAFA